MDWTSGRNGNREREREKLMAVTIMWAKKMRVMTMAVTEKVRDWEIFLLRVRRYIYISRSWAT